MESVIGLRAFVSPHMRLARDRALATNRSTYQWEHIPGLPAFCRGLPEPERIPRFQRTRLEYDVVGTVVNALVGRVAWVRDGVKENNQLKHYDDFYPLRPKPAVSARWRTDSEFARQRLNGVNPLLIKRIAEVPENFAVTDARVRDVLPESTSLAALLAAGRLFVCDWAPMAGVPVAFGRFLTTPMAMFWLDNRGQLMPLAIQLGQSVVEAPVVFTPADERWVWLLARTHVQAADSAWHETVVHLFRTHLIMETVWVAVRRALPPQHPVHALLTPHFAGTININVGARTMMIVPGGPIDKAIGVGSDGAYWLVAEALKSFSFTDLDPVADLRARGVEDPVVLPGYYYRDDAIMHWASIRTFVHDVLRAFYPDDVTVAADDELAAWAVTLTAADEGGLRGLPLTDGRFASFADLHQVVSQVIFTATCEHSAVNNGQYDIFGYIPNAPGAMYLPPPMSLAPSSEGELTYSLPPLKAVNVQLELVHMLSTPSLSRLGDYPDDFFHENQAVRKAIDRFQASLDRIAIAISERNAQVAVPYWYLDPARVANSINV